MHIFQIYTILNKQLIYLHSLQIHTINGFQTTYPVMIQVFRGSSTNHIHIQGRDKDTANVYAKIKDVFHEAEIIEVRAKAEKELHDKVRYNYYHKS